jgi:hypothetical protein
MVSAHRGLARGGVDSAMVINWGVRSRTEPKLARRFHLYVPLTHIHPYSGIPGVNIRPGAYIASPTAYPRRWYSSTPGIGRSRGSTPQQRILAEPLCRLVRSARILARLVRRGPHAGFKTASPIGRKRIFHGEKTSRPRKANHQRCTRLAIAISVVPRSLCQHSKQPIDAQSRYPSTADSIVKQVGRSTPQSSETCRA